MDKLKEALQRANRQLGRSSIVVRREKLRLNAIYPPRPGEADPKRREVALGCAYTVPGIQTALKLALKIEAQLTLGEFDWQPYLKGAQKTAGERSVGEWVQAFEQRFWLTHRDDVNTRNYWRKDWLTAFNKLPWSAPLTEEILINTIEAIEPDTRTRQRVCHRFQSLARFAGLDVNLTPYQGSYAAVGVELRTLPTDDEILAARSKIPSDRWRNVFDLMACYGIRNHEAFYLDWESVTENGIIRLTEGKTGGRLIYPVKAGNWQAFDPLAGLLPDIRLDRAHNAVGETVNHYLRKYLPFKPYDLRHSWARRSFESGLPSDFCARAMGHSLEVHLKTYRRLWGDEPYKKVFEQTIG